MLNKWYNKINLKNIGGILMETALRVIVSSTLIAMGLLVTAAGVGTALGKIDVSKAADLLPSSPHKDPIVVKVVPDNFSHVIYY